MADKINPPEGATGFPDADAHNEKINRELEAQNALKVVDPKDLADTGDALDKLLVEKSKKAEEDAEATKKKADAEAKGGIPVAGSEEAKKKAEQEAAAAKKKTDDEVAAKKKAEEDEVVKKKADDFFKDSPGLPPGASPKSSEAFSTIKIKAAQELSARDSKIAELDKQIKDLQEKLKNPVPPELDKEVKDLRAWRAKLDVDADPKFKEFDKQVSTAQEFIYAQLKKSPAISDEVIQEIKKFGGPENVNMSKIFDHVKDPTLQRLVESKLADIEMAKFNKEAAIKVAKENISQYMTERQKQLEQVANGDAAATQKFLGELTAKLDWFKEKKAPDNADEATKQSVNDYNNFVTDTKKQLDAALQDNSPEMKAIMIAGMAQLFHLQRTHEGTLAEVKTKDAMIAQKDATIKELTEKIDRLKSASVSRFRESGAPPGGNLPQPKKDVDFTLTAGEALDNIAKGIIETRAKASGAGA